MCIDVNQIPRQIFNPFITDFKNGLLLAENIFWNALEVIMLRKVYWKSTSCGAYYSVKSEDYVSEVRIVLQVNQL